MNKHSNFPRVYPILDTAALEQTGCGLVNAAMAMVEGGAKIIQLRHKGFWSAEVVDLAGQTARICSEAGVQFIINDRADYAALLHVGLHVGQDDLAPRDARALIGDATTLGFSTHNLEQLSAADRQPVTYLALGPIYETRSKLHPDAAVGVTLVAKARELTSKPLVAIGGITPATAPEVWRAGADSIAIIGSVLAVPCGTAEIQERMKAWIRQGELYT